MMMSQVSIMMLFICTFFCMDFEETKLDEWLACRAPIHKAPGSIPTIGQSSFLLRLPHFYYCLLFVDGWESYQNRKCRFNGTLLTQKIAKIANEIGEIGH